MSEFFFSSLRLGVPLFFAAMGGLIAERSGVATLCLEGALLISAFAAAVADHYTHSPFLSLLVAMMASSFFMSLHAFLTQKTKVDHIISGVALNLLAAGLTPLLCKLLFDNTTNSPSLPSNARIHSLWPFFVSALSLPFLIHFLLYKTAFGLRLRSCGDGPEAVTAAGLSVGKTRALSLILSGICISFGGSYLSIAHSDQFVRDMTAGKGFIALAAVIFGKWKPIPTLFSCFFFAFMEALQLNLQSVGFGGFTLPVQWVQAIPYLLTLVVLVTAIGAARPPLALGDTKR